MKFPSALHRLHLGFTPVLLLGLSGCLSSNAKSPPKDDLLASNTVDCASNEIL